MFEIRVNGIPRSYRDLEKNAIEAGRLLKGRDKSAEITVVNMTTRPRAAISDQFSEVVWKDAPALAVVRQTA